MDRKAIGMLALLVLSVVVPVLVGEYLSYRALNKPCPVPAPIVKFVPVTPTVTATPSATLAPTKRVVRPTVVEPTNE